MSSSIAQRPSYGNANASGAAEYLTFRLGEEEYGIDILRVQEIRSYEQPTRMAHAPEFIKGVIDLRGVIVPIVDLRLKLHCASADYTDFTVVIILNVGGHGAGRCGGCRGRRGGSAGRCHQARTAVPGAGGFVLRAWHRDRGRAHADRGGHRIAAQQF